jgi:hypothetical protein
MIREVREMFPSAGNQPPVSTRFSGTKGRFRDIPGGTEIVDFGNVENIMAGESSHR